MKIIEIRADNIQTILLHGVTTNDIIEQLKNHFVAIIENNHDILMRNLMICDDNNLSKYAVYDVMQNDAQKIEKLLHFLTSFELTFNEIKMLINQHFYNLKIINMLNCVTIDDENDM
jgi:hypothetical protein